MTDHKRNPEEILEDTLNKHVLFQKLEIATGVVAGAGTIALGVMQNAAVFAAAPLTIGMALNYFNRLRASQISRYQNHIEVAEVQRRLSAEVQGLKPAGASEMGLTSNSQMEDAIATLAEKMAALEMQLQSGVSQGEGANPLADELIQLRNHQLDLSQSLEAINQQIHNLPAASATASSTGDVDVESLRQEFQSLLTPVQHTLASLESQVAAQPAVAPSAPVDVEPLKAELSQMLAPVQQQVSALEERLVSAQSEPAAAPGVDASALDAVHGQVTALNDRLDSVVAQLSAEIAGFQQSVQQTQERVEAVHQHLSAAPTASLTPEAVRQEVQSILSPLREQLGTLEQKISGLPVVDPHVSQLQAEQMISLQNQLNSTNSALEELGTHLSNHLTAELSRIPQMVDAQISQKVAQLQPATPTDKKQDALSELDAILADINL